MMVMMMAMTPSVKEVSREVVMPCAARGSGEQVGGQQRQYGEHRANARFSRELELEHHDGEHDGDDAIGQCIEAAWTHPIPRRLVAGRIRRSWAVVVNCCLCADPFDQLIELDRLFRCGQCVAGRKFVFAGTLSSSAGGS